jgi:hypothetical protein
MLVGGGGEASFWKAKIWYENIIENNFTDKRSKPVIRIAPAQDHAQ